MIAIVLFPKTNKRIDEISNMTMKDNLKVIELEQTINKQTQEIQDLKRLVADLGEKITRDIKTEEEKKQAGTAY